mgnify:CR=1 FL=1
MKKAKKTENRCKNKETQKQKQNENESSSMDVVTLCKNVFLFTWLALYKQLSIRANMMITNYKLLFVYYKFNRLVSIYRNLTLSYF